MLRTRICPKTGKDIPIDPVTGNDLPKSPIQVGWFDYPGQETPTFDPPHDGPCVICENPLIDPVTISLMREGEFERSYFYRAHKSCYQANPAAADAKVLDFLEQATMEEK